MKELFALFLAKTDWMKTFVGISMIGVFSFLVYAIIYVPLPDSAKEIIIHVLGIMEGAVIGIVTYYYGSSKGSQQKQEIIADQAKQAK
jgi:hypothetical protein